MVQANVFIHGKERKIFARRIAREKGVLITEQLLLSMGYTQHFYLSPEAKR